MLAGGDPDGAGRRLAQRGQRRQLRVDLRKARSDIAQQALAGFRRCDAAGGAGEQPQAEPLLQRAHGVAERGLRHAELGGRAGEAALAGDREEGEEVVDVGAGHS
ncbi:hypothetical protein BDS110ZK17_58360 [Bradyrhizobium diazoefficiens]|nr:hypothetical protein XF16B_59690 [Bradyrhizobium diazoefficiens]BCF71629.1 hypothetical protein XF19B_59820 [Bradyrhizobium diazoefficiens]